jgi:predicted esterase
MRTGCCGSRHNGAPPVATTISCASSLAPGFGRLVLPALLCVNAALAAAQSAERGTIVDPVVCASDASQTYALYLPSAYSADRKWSLLLAFHPAARGRQMVETYRAAAERYGYIVAASNNSRNGPYAVSAAAARAMGNDAQQRFAVDARRIYLAGFSGGARFSTGIALGSTDIAGVIASSAGFPDSLPRDSAKFPIFGTAGTEDFNYIEMRLLDRALTTPHRVVVFEGGHTLPPPPVAMDAIEWLELQAMKSSAKPRDEPLIDQLLGKRQQAMTASTSSAATVHLLQELASDFGGLRDVAGFVARAAELSKQKDVKSALSRERAEDDAEARQVGDVFALEAALRDQERRMESLGRLRDALQRLARQANADTDSTDRRRARRLLRTITSGISERGLDPEYRKLLEQYRQPGAGRGGG